VVTPSADIRRSTYLQSAFSSSGIHSSNTSTSTYAHITPPRSSGTEMILLSANWVSRDGSPNLRGVAMLLSLADFLQGQYSPPISLTIGQNHWAFDFVPVVAEGYFEGLKGFMEEYYALFGGVIWTGLNIDYPGHSFSHIGLFYGEPVDPSELSGRGREWSATESRLGELRLTYRKIRRRSPDEIA